MTSTSLQLQSALPLSHYWKFSDKYISAYLIWYRSLKEVNKIRIICIPPSTTLANIRNKHNSRASLIEKYDRGLPFENEPKQLLCVRFALQKIFITLIRMLFVAWQYPHQEIMSIYWSKIMLNVTIHIKTFISLNRYKCSRRNKYDDSSFYESQRFSTFINTLTIYL